MKPKLKIEQRLEELTSLLLRHSEHSDWNVIRKAKKYESEDPSYKEMYRFYQAMAYNNLSKLQEAIRIYFSIDSEEIIRKWPQVTLRFYVNFAGVFYGLQKYNEALELIEKVEDKIFETTDAYVFYICINVYFETYQYEKMKILCEKYLKGEENFINKADYIKVNCFTKLLSYYYEYDEIEQFTKCLIKYLSKNDLKEVNLENVDNFLEYLRTPILSIRNSKFSEKEILFFSLLKNRIIELLNNRIKLKPNVKTSLKLISKLNNSIESIPQELKEKNVFNLKDLLKSSANERHIEISTGKPVGKEIW